MAIMLWNVGRAPAGATKRYLPAVTNPYAPPEHDGDATPVASLGLRAAAVLLDVLVMLVAAVVLHFVNRALDYSLPPQIGVLVAAPIALARLFGGQTPGERLCGIKRVKIDGKRRWIVVR
jgi:uncharacterized RDD family membrane protein YckC